MYVIILLGGWGFPHTDELRNLPKVLKNYCQELTSGIQHTKYTLSWLSNCLSCPENYSLLKGAHQRILKTIQSSFE